jgi:hypothetical protein
MVIDDGLFISLRRTALCGSLSWSWQQGERQQAKAAIEEAGRLRATVAALGSRLKQAVRRPLRPFRRPF